MSKMIRKGQLWWASGPLAGGLVLSIFKGYSSENALMILAVLSVAISLPMYFLYPHYFKYQNKKQIIKLQVKGSYDVILGEHEMTITDDHLSDCSGNNINAIQWDSIDRIETLTEHTYVFTDEVTAYIIPHAKVSSGRISLFIEALNSQFRKSRGHLAT